MKSGTNEYHGSGYDYLRNRALDANSWVTMYRTIQLPEGGPSTSPVDTQNDFGVTFGGPVNIPHLYNGKNKTFFFVDYEGFRFRNGGTNIDTLPPEAFRNGDFSALLTGQTDPRQ